MLQFFFTSNRLNNSNTIKAFLYFIQKDGTFFKNLLSLNVLFNSQKSAILKGVMQ